MNVLYFDSPIGCFGVAEKGGDICAVYFRDEMRDVTSHMEQLSDSITETSPPVLVEARQQIDDYFTGHRSDFDLPYTLEGCSDFTQTVLAELSTVRRGETLTYAQLGERVGRPRSARAVGRAMATNPLPLIIPCHRVLAAGNKLNGYSGGKGLVTKEWLLSHEGVVGSLLK